MDGERTKQDLQNPVLPGGAFANETGSYSSPFREVEALGKLDWQINSKYHFFYRFSYDQNHSVLAFIPNSFQPFGNVNHTPDHAMGLDFSTGSYTHSIRFGYMKFRNGIVDAVAGSSLASNPVFNPAPGLELAIGNDPDCLTAGADDFCSGPNFLAPQQTYQSDHQIKYDGSKALGAHIFRYGGGFNHISGGGFASFLALAPAVGAGIADCARLCHHARAWRAERLIPSTIPPTRCSWATDRAMTQKYQPSAFLRAAAALTTAFRHTSETPGRSNPT